MACVQDVSEFEPFPLTITLVERHSRLGRRLSVVAGPSGAGSVEVIFQVCDGRVSAEDFSRLACSLPRGGSLRKGTKDYELRCVVIYCEPEPNSFGAKVFHASAVLGVDERTRPGLAAGRAVAAKVDRHRVFASWLLSTFGARFGAGSCVLDVAGGQGCLADELAHRGVSVTIVDPRTDGHEHEVEVGNIGEGVEKDFPSGAGLVRETEDETVPVPTVMSPATVEISANVPENQMEANSDHARVLRLKTDFDPVGGLVNSCGAIVAMHPDQATEAVVDAAVTRALPFAVVPCCVFPRLFSKRRLQSGRGVTGYAGFLRYLREKDARMRAAQLPFEGRNIVLFMTAADYRRESHSKEPGPLRAPLWRLELESELSEVGARATDSSTIPAIDLPTSCSTLCRNELTDPPTKDKYSIQRR